jgi:hypothetical protein
VKAVVFALALALGSRSAGAACPAESQALAAQNDEVRLVWIQTHLARTAHSATVWLRGWEIGIASAGAINVALIPILGDTHDHRVVFGIGAAAAFIGLIPFVFMPPRVIADHRTVDALAASSADRCAVLAEAERRLAASAAAQRKQRAWYMHVGNIAFNTGIALVFGAFGHWGAGAASGIAGAAVGEAIIFTHANGSIDDLARYHRGDLGEHASWQLVPTGTGVAFAYHWR